MNRPIEFRAWDKVRKCLTPVVCLNLGTWTDVILIHPDSEKLGRQETYNQLTENVELMQFTGLLDKNGKKVFEGDILSYPEQPIGNVGVVVWDNSYGNARFAINTENHFGKFVGSAFEVIGNIWEHPKLLSLEGDV